jgi:hypothetical protein
MAAGCPGSLYNLPYGPGHMAAVCPGSLCNLPYGPGHMDAGGPGSLYSLPFGPGHMATQCHRGAVQPVDQGTWLHGALGHCFIVSDNVFHLLCVITGD